MSGLKALTGLEMCYPMTTRAYHSGGTSVGDEHLEMRGEKKKEGNAKENDLKMGENDLLSLFFLYITPLRRTQTSCQKAFFAERN